MSNYDFNIPTPGPWQLMRFDGGASWGVTAEDRFIASMHGGANGHGNAVLIATAPDMLEELRLTSTALGEMADDMGCDAGNPDGGSSQTCEHCQMARWVGRIDALIGRVDSAWEGRPR